MKDLFFKQFTCSVFDLREFLQPFYGDRNYHLMLSVTR